MVPVKNYRQERLAGLKRKSPSGKSLSISLIHVYFVFWMRAYTLAVYEIKERIGSVWKSGFTFSEKITGERTCLCPGRPPKLTVFGKRYRLTAGGQAYTMKISRGEGQVEYPPVSLCLAWQVLQIGIMIEHSQLTWQTNEGEQFSCKPLNNKRKS